MHESQNSRHVANSARIALANNGYLRIYNVGGGIPASADAALGTAALLAEHKYAATAFGADVNGVATSAAIADVATLVSGTGAFARTYASDGTTCLWQSVLGTSGTEVTVPTLTYTALVQSHINSVTITQPDGS